MDIERVVVRLLADAVPFQQGLDRAAAGLEGFVRRVSANGHAIAVPFVIAARAISSLTDAFLTAASASVRMATDFETSSTALEVMTGDAYTAAKILEDINQLAIRTPFKSAELVGVAQQLKAFGFETDQLTTLLGRLGDVAAGTTAFGSMDDKLRRIVLAFGQIRVAGRLMGPELRQMTDAGVPLMEYLAKVMGKPTTAIKGLVEEGKVSYPAVAAAFNMMTSAGGTFAGMMDRQNQTVKGQFSSLVESAQLVLREFGMEFFAGFGLKDILGDMSEFVTTLRGAGGQVRYFSEQLRSGFDFLVNFVREVIRWGEANSETILTVLKVIGAVAGFTIAFLTLRVAIGAVVGMVQLFRIGLLTLFSPIGLLTAAVAAFGYSVYKETGSAQKVLDAFARVFADLRRRVEYTAAAVADFVDRNQDMIIVFLKTIAVFAGVTAAANGFAIALTAVGGGLMLVGGGLLTLFRVVGFLGLAFSVFGDIPETLKSVSSAVKDTTSDTEALRNTLKSVAGAVIMFGTAYFTAAAAVRILSASLIVYRGVMIAVTAVTAAYGIVMVVVRAAMVAFNFLLNPIPLLAFGIALHLLVNHWDDVKGVINEVVDALGNFFSGRFDLTDFMDRMRRLFDQLTEVFGKTWAGVSGAIAGGDLKLAAEIAFSGLKTAWVVIINALKEEWSRFIHWIKMGKIREELSTGLAAGAAIAEAEAYGGAGRVIEFFGGPALDQDKINKDRDEKLKILHDMQQNAIAIQDRELENRIKPFHEATRKAIEEHNALAQKGINLAQPAPQFDVLSQQDEEMRRAVGLFNARVRVKSQQLSDAMIEGLSPDWDKWVTKNSLGFASSVRSLGSVIQGPAGVWMETLATRGNLAGKMTVEYRKQVEAMKEGLRVMNTVQAVMREMPSLPVFASEGEGSFMERLGKRVRSSIDLGLIRVPVQISGETREYAADIRREMNKQLDKGIGSAVGQYDKFLENLEFGKAAYMGPLKEAALPTQTLMGALAGFVVPTLPQGLTEGGEFTKDQFDFAKLYELEKMRKFVGAGKPDEAPALLRGSVEAQNVINQNQSQQVSIQEEIRNIMLRAQVLQAEQRDYARRTAAAMDRIAADLPKKPELTLKGVSTDGK